MRSTRRKTLSELNSNNTRGGACPGEETATRKTWALGVSGKQATPACRNHQGKPNNSQRRHSVYFSSGQTPRVDPRPLGDKAYINSCVRQLISFLSSRGFDSALSPKTLAAPTAKEFAALALFLFRQADENFKFGSKTEDDVPTVFKQLRYPFQISKSALYAVGSPHTWPSLLTALTWLVQIFIYEEEAGRNEAKVSSVDGNVSFFKYVSSAYRHFLAGDDAECEKLEREFASARSEKVSQMMTSTTQLEQENAELEALLNSLMQEPPHKTALQNEKEGFLKGVQKYEADVEAMRHFVESSERHSTLAMRNARQHEDCFQACREEIVNLRQRVSTQPIDVSEAMSTDKEIQKQRDVLMLIKAQQSDVESRACATEVEAEQALADLESKVKLYNSVARKLQLIPQTAKYANATCFEAAINPRAQTEEMMVNVDFRSVRTAVKTIHEEHMQQKWRYEREYVNLEQNLQACQDTLIETQDEANGLSLKATRCETSYDSERKRLDGILANIMKDLGEVENEVEIVRRTSDSDSSETEAALYTCQVERDACVKVCGEERLAVQNVMLAALDALMGHKQQVQDALDAISSSNAKLIEASFVV